MNHLEQWKRARQECRTNLYYLCRVLAYNDVQESVHGDLIANLQQFKGGIDSVESKEIANLKEDQVALPSVQAIKEGYKPFVPDFWSLEGPRKRANFFPRGCLKTTIQTFAHTIQWIINYPDIRVLLSTHTDGAAKEMVNEIRKHFTANATFRYLFPEHVPLENPDDFGNQEHFDTLARSKWTKEHTFSFLTIGSHLASRHFDVIKHEDLVDAENVKTADRIASVRQHLGDMEPLLEKHEHPTRGEMKGWEDLAGTFYDFSDANYTLWETESQRPKEKQIWSVVMRSAAPNYPEGPFLWPGRIGPKALKEVEEDPNRGPAILAAQYLMNPIPPGSGLVESKEEIIWTARKIMNELYARLSLYVAIDLNGMDSTQAAKNRDNDYTAGTLGGFGTDGHLYVPEIFHGRPSPQAVIEWMFDVYHRHPRIIAFKVPKDAFARVLLKFLRSEESRRNIWLPIMEIPIDNQRSKQDKIRGLQPWFKRGMIHFVDDLPCKTAIINEIMRFPKFNHDDILDTLCDLMSSRDGRAAGELMVTQRDDSVESGDPFEQFMAEVYGNKEEQFTTEAVMGW
jgi:predicted phage terminase large subunit-like protein